MDRASDSGSEGRGFESLHTRFIKSLEITNYMLLQGFLIAVLKGLSIKISNKLSILSAIIGVKMV